MTVDSRIIDLYNEYVHSALPRREFLGRLTSLVGSVAAATTVLAVLEPNYAKARQVEPDDKRLKTEKIEFNGPNGAVHTSPGRRRLANPTSSPRAGDPREPRLPTSTSDVARRVAPEGYVAIAPDGLSSAGGAPADQEAARDLFAKTDGARIATDVLAAVPWLAADPANNGKIGVVGFCFGGGLALRAAIEAVGVDCAVSYYGRQLSAEDTRRLKVPVMLHMPEPTSASRGHSRVSRGARCGGRAVQPQHVPGHTARVQQRCERSPLQRAGSEAGLAPHDRFFRYLSEDWIITAGIYLQGCVQRGLSHEVLDLDARGFRARHGGHRRRGHLEQDHQQ
jgi:carboxymethylenebutenolidase